MQNDINYITYLLDDHFCKSNFFKFYMIARNVRIRKNVNNEDMTSCHKHGSFMSL